MSTILPLLRQVAPRLTRQLFTCSRYCQRSDAPTLLRQRYHFQLRNARKISGNSPKLSTPSLSSHDLPGPPLEGPAHLASENTNARGGDIPVKKGLFPEESQKSVAYWLLGSAASVFGLVVLGGLTRLTESGLSITEWRPVTGSLPPGNEAEWELEFQKYQSSPEFKLLNPNMTMTEFKKIYYMEWTHRLWGRAVGISFLIPAVYFIARRRVTRPMALRIAGISGLIGFQGVLGWWMVKSGLKDDLFAPGSHPRVSQYRLVAHLGTAFTCYTAMLWSGLQILREERLLSRLDAAETMLVRLRHPKLRVFRNSIGALACLVFITAMSGGFVAGLDAGLIYNEFPKMGNSWIPPAGELFSDFYSNKADGRDLWWRNALENPSLAQLDHRILATSTFSAVVALFAYSRFAPQVRKLIPIGSRKAMHGVLGFACLQVALGITTLIYLVPLPLASAHQAGSLALLSYVIILGSRTWLPSPRFSALLARRVAATKPAAARKALQRLKIHGERGNMLKAFPELQTRF